MCICRPPFNYSTVSPMRKSGFLSYERLLDTLGNTIFKPCNTIQQCFKDSFTFRGKDATRRVYIDAMSVGNTLIPSYMRDWKPNDATKCGIFGIWLSDGQGNSINDMCPGAPDSSYYCCAVDVAVAPLQYVFSQYPSTLDELDSKCNVAFSTSGSMLDRSYSVFSKRNVQNLVQRIGRYYAVPKQGGKETVKLYMGMLNELLNEFSPPEGKA